MAERGGKYGDRLAEGRAGETRIAESLAEILGANCESEPSTRDEDRFLGVDGYLKVPVQHKTRTEDYGDFCAELLHCEVAPPGAPVVKRSYCPEGSSALAANGQHTWVFMFYQTPKRTRTITRAQHEAAWNHPLTVEAREKVRDKLRKGHPHSSRTDLGKGFTLIRARTDGDSVRAPFITYSLGMPWEVFG